MFRKPWVILRVNVCSLLQNVHPAQKLIHYKHGPQVRLFFLLTVETHFSLCTVMNTSEHALLHLTTF